MKKTFYNLMDRYESESLPDYEVSAKNVKKIVMEKTGLNTKAENTQKYHLTKKAVAAVAAVSVAAVTGISVAAYSTGVLEIASNFFEKNAFFYEEEKIDLNENDLEVIKNNLREEHITAESNGATIELTGSMYDENVIYYFCTMTLPEGTKIPADSSLDFEIVSTERSSFLGKSFGLSLGSYFMEDENPYDNKIDFACYISVTGEIDTSSIKNIFFENLNSTSGEIVNGVNGSHYRYSSVVKGQWFIPIKYKCEKTMTEVLDKPVKTFIQTINDDGIHNHDIQLQSIKISPLSMEIQIDGLNKETPFMSMSELSTLESEVTLVMKNSTEETKAIGHGIHGITSIPTEFLTFEKPIDVSQIDYIKIGNAVIDMN